MVAKQATARKKATAKKKAPAKKKATVKKKTPAKKSTVQKKAAVKRTAVSKRKTPAKKKKVTAAVKRSSRAPKSKQELPPEVEAAAPEQAPASPDVSPAPQQPAPQQVVNQEQNRAVGIGHDAIGNAIISGDGNIVVVQNITQHAPQEPEKPADDSVSDIGPNPYKGLVAFDESDADHFFGREAQTRRLWGMFRDLHEAGYATDPPPRVLPILGPSGSGKSSLARAGLIPELARNPIPGMKAARVAVLKPGAHPLEALAGVLARIATNDPAPLAKTDEFSQELLRRAEDGEYDGLRRIAASLPNIAGSRLIVFIDQFEEIYSLCNSGEERVAFIDNLIYAASDREALVSVIFTSRTDFLEETQQHAKLNSIIAERGAIIPSMKEDELRLAITEPARLAGHPLDKATVDLLINETKNREGALPLLQFALRRIWDGMAKGIEPSQTLEDIGGVGGALAREAERIFEDLSDKDKKIARRIFLGLVQLGDGTPDTRRRAAVQSLIASVDNPEDFQMVIDRFSDSGARLITLTADTEGIQSTEVTHEALFEHWRLLDEWLEESRDDLRFQRRLDQAARHWESGGRPTGSLWRPPDLDVALDYRGRAADDMTPLQLNFVAGSKAIHAKEVKRDRLRRKMILCLSVVSGILVVVAVVASGLGYMRADKQRRAAEKNQREAEEHKKTALENSERAWSVLQDFFSVLTEDSFLRAQGMEPLRHKLLLKAEEAFREIVVEDDEVLKGEVADTHYRIALVEADEGKTEEAYKELKLALEIQKELLEKNPNSPELMLALSNSINHEGLILTEADPLEALEKYQACVDLRERLVEEFPKHENYEEHVRLLANGRLDYGRLCQNVTDQVVTAKEEGEAAAMQLSELESKKPDAGDEEVHQEQLAEAKQAVSDAQSKLEKAERLQSALTKKLEKDPMVVARGLYLQSQREQLSDLLEIEDVQAIVPFGPDWVKKAVASQNSENPVKRELLHDIGMGYYNLATLTPEGETDTKPRQYLQASIASFKALVEGDRSDVDGRFKLARSMQRLAELLREDSSENETRTEVLTDLYRRIGVHMDHVAGRTPDVIQYQMERYKAHDSLRAIAAAKKDTTTLLETSFATQQTLLDLIEHGTDAKQARLHREALVDLWLSLANLDLFKSQPQARDYLTRAKEYLVGLHAEFPDSEEYEAKLADVETEIQKLVPKPKPPAEPTKPAE